jgi:hypothetical protein
MEKGRVAERVETLTEPLRDYCEMGNEMKLFTLRQFANMAQPNV